MKIINVNCGVKNYKGSEWVIYMKVDHRSYSATFAFASITAMIFLHIILHSAVYKYDFHIFIILSSSFNRFITNQFNDLLPVVSLA